MFVWGTVLSVVTTAIFYFIDPDEDERLAREAKARAQKGPAEGEEEAEPEPGDWHRGPAGARWCDRLCFPAVFARQEQAQAPTD